MTRIYRETERLILREWSEADIAEFVRMNEDPLVMEFLLKKLSLEESLDFYRRIQDEFREKGFGLYAVEEKSSRAFMGYVGLHQVGFEADFAPAVEIGWRLLPELWGRGYASEAAQACIEYVRDELDLTEVVSYTSLLNQRSERVMQKIGMTRMGEFDHPLVDAGHRLLRHVLYRIELG